VNCVALAFLTCDRVELTRRSIVPLAQPNKFDLHWVDGSKTKEGKQLPFDPNIPGVHALHENIYGGSGPAIVYALTMLLNSNYDFIGLCENDVLLDGSWFDDMMALFSKGHDAGLEVGAVSARCYEDRILIQRDGYAVMHNLGAGMIMFTRQAAQLVLQHYRTVWTTENRLLFAQLSGIDIGRYWAFRGNAHFLVADWNFDRVLASHGLASLALTPNRATMLDQDIEPLGLKYADGNFALARNPEAFELYSQNLTLIRNGILIPGVNTPFFRDEMSSIIFAHQVPQLGGIYTGGWHVRDFQPFGPFCWRVGDSSPELAVWISGACEFVVSGGKDGGKVRIEDLQSGYVAEPFLPPEQQTNFLSLPIPTSASYRPIKLTALAPGICFFAVKVLNPQPWLPHVKFDYSTLPPP
jgi:hypothetical protein